MTRVREVHGVPALAVPPSAGLSPSPWTTNSSSALVVLLTVSLGGIATAWYGCSGAGTWTTQMRWLTLGVASTALAGAGCAAWLLQGFTATRAVRSFVVWSLRTSPVQAEPATAPEQGGAVVLDVPSPAYSHAPDCQLVAGKAVRARRENTYAQLQACPVCQR